MFRHFQTGRYHHLLKNCGLPYLQRSALCGTSRSLCFSHQPRSLETATHTLTVAEMLSPFMFLYVWWVLRRSRQDGIEKLFFLARDGLLLKRIADVLIESWGLETTTHYLRCSRESLMLPAVGTMTDFELKWLTWGFRSELSLAEIARRLRVDVESLAPFFKTGELAGYLENPYAFIDRKNVAELMQMLRDESFSRFIERSSRNAFGAVNEYLVQEGLAGSRRPGIVDTGWYGSSQYALSSILDKAGKYPKDGLAGYYIGVNEGADIFASDRLSGFLFDGLKRGGSRVAIHHLCVEMLCAANEGRTVGYDRCDDRILPVQERKPEGYAVALIERQHQVAVEYSRRISRVIDFEEMDCGAAADLCCRLVREFSMNPSRQEAEIFGSWPMACEMGERDCQEMAPAMGFGMFMSCAVGRKKIEGFWPQASLVRGGCGFVRRLYNLVADLNLLGLYRKYILRY